MEEEKIKHCETIQKDKKVVEITQHDVSVTTYVLYSGNVKNPVTEYTEGVNTYRIVPLVMQGYDAENYFKEIRKKIK